MSNVVEILPRRRNVKKKKKEKEKEGKKEKKRSRDFTLAHLQICKGQ